MQTARKKVHVQKGVPFKRVLLSLRPMPFTYLISNTLSLWFSDTQILTSISLAFSSDIKFSVVTYNKKEHVKPTYTHSLTVHQVSSFRMRMHLNSSCKLHLNNTITATFCFQYIIKG